MRGTTRFVYKLSDLFEAQFTPNPRDDNLSVEIGKRLQRCFNFSHNDWAIGVFSEPWLPRLPGGFVLVFKSLLRARNVVRFPANRCEKPGCRIVGGYLESHEINQRVLQRVVRLLAPLSSVQDK